MNLKDFVAYSIIFIPFILMICGFIYYAIEPYIIAMENKAIRDKEELEKLYTFEDYEK